MRIRQPYGLGFHLRASASCDAYPIPLLEPRAQLDSAKRAADQHVGADTPSHRELGGSDCVARAAIATSSKTGRPAIPLKLRLIRRRSGSKPTLVFMPA
jgi:hypothetical protein